MTSTRDDFLPKVKDILAKRAGYICSNPECRANTLAPSEEDPHKTIYIGKAAHVCAASPNGPRYNPAQSPEERSSISNAIFLCSSCADKIDKNNGIDFPVSLLLNWKDIHEKWIRDNLNKKAASEQVTIVDSNPYRDQIIARSYFTILSEFLIRFRFNLHCLLPEPIETSIENAFHPGRDLLTTAPDLEKISQELLVHIFTKYDFKKPMINYQPETGSIPTNLAFLASDLASLLSKVQILLIKYASTAHTELLQNMELIKNRAENLLGPFGITSQFGLSQSNIESLGELFELLKRGFTILESILS